MNSTRTPSQINALYSLLDQAQTRLDAAIAAMGEADRAYDEAVVNADGNVYGQVWAAWCDANSELTAAIVAHDSARDELYS